MSLDHRDLNTKKAEQGHAADAKARGCMVLHIREERPEDKVAIRKVNEQAGHLALVEHKNHAVNAGIKRLAVAATLNSVPFYTARGFSSRCIQLPAC
jgi:hypothetical protein